MVDGDDSPWQELPNDTFGASNEQCSEELCALHDFFKFFLDKLKYCLISTVRTQMLLIMVLNAN